MSPMMGMTCNLEVRSLSFETGRLINLTFIYPANVLGHFYLTKLLLPVLISTAKSSPDRHVRVVTTSSLGHVGSRCLDFETFKDGPQRLRAGRFGTTRLYFQSKLVCLPCFRNIHSLYLTGRETSFLHENWQEGMAIKVSYRPGKKNITWT